MEQSIEDIKIALALKAVRCIMDMSIMEVAAYCKVSGSSVSKWEAGELSVRMSTFMQLTKMFQENGIHLDISGDSVNIKIDDTGIEKIGKYLQQKTKLRKGETIDIDSDTDKYVVVPKIRTRRGRSKEM